MKPKVTVGQRLYSLNVGNNARHREQVLTPVVVSKVGRKYFTVKTEGQYALETEYRIEDWRENHEYCANSALYETEQEWADEKETRHICQKIWKAFEYGHNRQNLNLETLRTIAAAINNMKTCKCGYVSSDNRTHCCKCHEPFAPATGSTSLAQQ